MNSRQTARDLLMALTLAAVALGALLTRQPPLWLGIAAALLWQRGRTRARSLPFSELTANNAGPVDPAARALTDRKGCVSPSESALPEREGAASAWARQDRAGTRP